MHMTRHMPSDGLHSNLSFQPVKPGFSLVGLGLCALLLSLTSAGCGSDTTGDTGDTAKGSSAKGGDGKRLGRKVAGPCSTTLISAADTTFTDYIVYAWDSKGRPIEEKSGTGADAVGGDTFTKKWGWNDAGKMVTKVFETSGSAPNYDYTFTYDAQGRVLTRNGTESGYGRIKCTYNYSSRNKDYEMLCLYEYDEYDDKGEKTNTVKGKFLVEYTYGMNQITESTSDAEGGQPSEVTRRFDEKGRLIALEINASLQDYPEEFTRYSYDTKDRLIKLEFFVKVDGKPEYTIDYSYDSYGNRLKDVKTLIDGSVDRTLVHEYGCW